MQSKKFVYKTIKQNTMKKVFLLLLVLATFVIGCEGIPSIRLQALTPDSTIMVVNHDTTGFLVGDVIFVDEIYRDHGASSKKDLVINQIPDSQNVAFVSTTKARILGFFR